MNSFLIKHVIGFELIVFMAMCVYKYVFNKHVKGEVGEARIQVFIIEGRPVLARGRGNAYVPCGSRAAPKGGGARTESSWSFWELGIWGAYNHNDNMKKRDMRTFSTGSVAPPLSLSLLFRSLDVSYIWENTSVRVLLS